MEHSNGFFLSSPKCYLQLSKFEARSDSCMSQSEENLIPGPLCVSKLLFYWCGQNTQHRQPDSRLGMVTNSVVSLLLINSIHLFLFPFSVGSL